MQETEVTIKAFHRSHRKTMQKMQEDLRDLKQDLASRKRSRIPNDEAITSPDSEAPRSPSPK